MPTSAQAFPRAAKYKLSGTDTLAVALTCIGSLGLAIEAGALPRYERMCKEFGGTLPGPTQFVLDTHLPFLALGVVGLLVFVAGLLHRFDAHTEGTVTLLVAALTSWSSMAFCLWALVLPVISLA